MDRVIRDESPDPGHLGRWGRGEQHPSPFAQAAVWR